MKISEMRNTQTHLNPRTLAVYKIQETVKIILVIVVEELFGCQET